VEARVSRQSFWNGRRVLITGCRGFLGSWLTRSLVEDGAVVAGLVRDRTADSRPADPGATEQIEQIPGDVRDLDLLGRAIGGHDSDTVFHLAAQAPVGAAKRDPVGTFETNIAGTWNVLEACRRNSVKRVVVASSDKAYGSHDRLPYDEGFALQGRQPYDVSKSCADLIAVAYHHAYGLPVAVTRCANLFGGGDMHWDRIVPGTIRAALEGTRPVIRSDGSPIRDYLYVADAVRAYRMLAEAMDDPAIHGQAFNFGTGEPVSVLDITLRILTLANREDLEPDVRGQAGDEISRQFLSASKADRLLGWQPDRSTDDALNDTIAWYRQALTR
jgi:CDP-glucose 4,6-dehydratase